MSVSEYHWSELWRSILSFIRFLTVYSTDLQELHHIHGLIHNLVNVVALALSSGDSFLPGAAEYDDLFYKLVETGDILTKFSDACKFSALIFLDCIRFEPPHAPRHVRLFHTFPYINSLTTQLCLFTLLVLVLHTWHQQI